MTVIVEGGDRLAATLGQAADQIADLDKPGRQAAEAVQRAARPPVRSGWLAASAVVQDTPEGAVAGWTAVYAGVIDQGWPGHNIRARHFAQDAAQKADWTAPYATHVQDALDTVKGK